MVTGWASSGLVEGKARGATSDAAGGGGFEMGKRVAGPYRVRSEDTEPVLAQPAPAV